MECTWRQYCLVCLAANFQHGLFREHFPLYTGTVNTIAPFCDQSALAAVRWTGSWRSAIGSKRIMGKKLSNIQQFLLCYPEYCFVFIGDRYGSHN